MGGICPALYFSLLILSFCAFGRTISLFSSTGRTEVGWRRRKYRFAFTGRRGKKTPGSEAILIWCLFIVSYYYIFSRVRHQSKLLPWRTSGDSSASELLARNNLQWAVKSFAKGTFTRNQPLNQNQNSLFTRTSFALPLPSRITKGIFSLFLRIHKFKPAWQQFASSSVLRNCSRPSPNFFQNSSSLPSAYNGALGFSFATSSAGILFTLHFWICCRQATKNFQPDSASSINHLETAKSAKKETKNYVAGKWWLRCSIYFLFPSPLFPNDSSLFLSNLRLSSTTQKFECSQRKFRSEVRSKTLSKSPLACVITDNKIHSLGCLNLTRNSFFFQKCNASSSSSSSFSLAIGTAHKVRYFRLKYVLQKLREQVIHQTFVPLRRICF